MEKSLILKRSLLLLEEDQLGVLSSDVNDRPDLRIEMLDGFCLGDDLIDKISAQKFGEKLSSDPREREGVKLFCRNPLENLFQDPLDGLKRLAFHAGVMFLQHVAVVIHDDRIGADGADIDTEIELFHFAETIH